MKIIINNKKHALIKYIEQGQPRYKFCTRLPFSWLRFTKIKIAKENISISNENHGYSVYQELLLQKYPKKKIDFVQPNYIKWWETQIPTIKQLLKL